MPKVSVIIPTYNRSHYVGEAIDSVLGQTFKDLEIIIVDDGSTDNTKQVLKNYASSIHYIFQEKKGRAEARNKGLKAAKGGYIAFLDDDDIWLPNKLEKQIIFLDAYPNIGLVHTFTEVIDEGGRLLGKETGSRLKLYKKAMRIGYTYEGMSQLCVMFMSTVMVRKECLNKIGLFDSRTESFEDWDFYLRFALKYRIDTIPEPLVKSRIHQKQSTRVEFTQGRIGTSMKHLSLLDSHPDFSSGNRIRHNFYVHLANAYYIDRQFTMFRIYALKILKLNPLSLFCSRLGIHFLMAMLPPNLMQKIQKIYH